MFSGTINGGRSGPSFIINPFTDRGSPDETGQWGIAVGAGGAAALPELLPVVSEVTVDVDVKTGDVTISIPKLGVGYGFYFGSRITGSCTACTPNIKQKLSSCWQSVVNALNGAQQKVTSAPIKLNEEQTIHYKLPHPPNEGEMDDANILF